MADRKLNEVPVVNDISHLLGVRSNGEIIRISKENMASVLGVIISNDKPVHSHRFMEL